MRQHFDLRTRAGWQNFLTGTRHLLRHFSRERFQRWRKQEARFIWGDTIHHAGDRTKNRLDAIEAQLDEHERDIKKLRQDLISMDKCPNQE